MHFGLLWEHFSLGQIFLIWLKSTAEAAKSAEFSKLFLCEPCALSGNLQNSPQK
jgi:hypothetical protein